MSQDPAIQALLRRLNVLHDQQRQLQRELEEIQGEVERIQAGSLKASMQPEVKTSSSPPGIEASTMPKTTSAEAEAGRPQRRRRLRQWLTPGPGWEEFVGGNLANKIGISVIIIGVAIGVKYAIDHDLIGPLARILLGYLVGGVLLGFAYRLRRRFENFSAVLLSGATAIAYFITYAAHSFYGLIPAGWAFALMVFITVYTVGEALRYRRQVIALIGLVGAYAIPFLLGGDPEKAAFLFTYIAIINAGILLISFREDWELLHYFAFVLSWLIFFNWEQLSYQPGEFFGPALVFAAVFFLLFYAMSLAGHLLRQDPINRETIILVVLNAFIFFGFGYDLINRQGLGTDLLGGFTALNALAHGLLCGLVFAVRGADLRLFHLLAVLGFIFLAIAIPIAFSSMWVALLWAAEAAFLFWLGRRQPVPPLEWLSYPLLAAAFLAMISHWSQIQPEVAAGVFRPLWNPHVGTGLLVSGIFATVYYLDRRSARPLRAGELVDDLVQYGIPIMLLVLLYNTGRLEVEHFWRHLGAQILPGLSASTANPAADAINAYTQIWNINYSLIFLALLAIVNLRRWRNAGMGAACIYLSGLLVLVFLTGSLWQFSFLRTTFWGESPEIMLTIEGVQLATRYLSFALLAGLFAVSYRLIGQAWMNLNFRRAFDLALHLTLLVVLSNELRHWLIIGGAPDFFNAGLSILWGLYAFGLAFYGIRQKQRGHRIGGIVLFGVVLAKVLLIDFPDFGAFTKTVVLVTLGALLLLVSFGYQRFKEELFG